MSPDKLVQYWHDPDLDTDTKLKATKYVYFGYGAFSVTVENNTILYYLLNFFVFNIQILIISLLL